MLRGERRQRVYVHAMADLDNARRQRLGGVFQQVGPVGHGRLFVHPHQRGGEPAGGLRRVSGRYQHVAAADVQLLFQADGDRHGCERLFQLALARHDGTHARLPSGRQHRHGVAAADHAGSELSRQAAEILRGADDVLHRQAQAGLVAILRNGHRLEIFQQRRPLVPGHAGAALHHVVAAQRAQGDELQIGRAADLRGKFAEIGADGAEHFLAVFHQVHLVDRDHQVADAQQGGDKGVAAGLRQHAVAGVDQHDGQVRGGGAGGHVAGVLLMPRRIGDDELAPRGGEVAIGHVDGDALLALGAQTVGEQRQVQRAVGLVAGGFADARELVFVNRLGIVKQAADEGGFAVVHAAGGGEAQKFAHPFKSNLRVKSSLRVKGNLHVKSNLRAS